MVFPPKTGLSIPFPVIRQIDPVTPANRIAEGYVKVGGGCEIEQGGKPGIPHNATMLKSIPTANGWSCAAGDPPNIPLPTRIEAYVVYCKLG